MELGSSLLLPVFTRHFRVVTWGRTRAIPFHCPIQDRTAIPELSMQDRTSLLRPASPVEPSSRIELPLRAKPDFAIIGENACYRIISEGISLFLLFLPFFPTPSFSVLGELHKPAPHFGAIDTASSEPRRTHRREMDEELLHQRRHIYPNSAPTSLLPFINQLSTPHIPFSGSLSLPSDAACCENC